MKEPKEGRGRTSAIDMTTETGRKMLRDMLHFKETGFSPFLRESYQSVKFWRSRPEYQKVPFGEFKAQAARMADIAINQLPEAEKQTIRQDMNRKSAEGPHDDVNKSKDGPIHLTDSSSCSKQYNNSRVQSLRDTIVSPHPNNEMAIVLFELDGDVQDATAFQLRFSQTGQKIFILFRVPKELTSAESLLGTTKYRNSIQDADCMLLDQVIKERLRGSEKDSDGELWEIRVIVDLPFPCKTCLFNKQGKKIDSFLLRTNEQGYGWGYFWVVGDHVRPKGAYPTTIRCEAIDDDESDGDQSTSSQDVSSDDEQNSCKLDSSEDEDEKMSVQSIDDSRKSATKHQRTELDVETSDILQLKHEYDTEIQKLREQLENTRRNATHMSETHELEKQNLCEKFNTEVQKLREQLDNTRRDATHTTEMHQAEKQNLCEHVKRLQQELEAKMREETSKDNWYNEQCRSRELKIEELTNNCHLKEREFQKNDEVKRQQIQHLEAQIHRVNEEKQLEICRVNTEKKNFLKAMQTKEKEHTKSLDDKHKQIQELEQTMQEKDEQHQKELIMKQRTIQTLEETIQHSLPELATLRAARQNQEDESMRKLKIKYEENQQLEQELSEKGKQLHSLLLQLNGLKAHSEYQRKFIRELKINIKKLEKCSYCGLKQVHNKLSKKFIEDKENISFDEEDFSWSQGSKNDDSLTKSLPDADQQFQQELDNVCIAGNEVQDHMEECTDASSVSNPRDVSTANFAPGRADADDGLPVHSSPVNTERTTASENEIEEKIEELQQSEHGKNTEVSTTEVSQIDVIIGDQDTAQSTAVDTAREVKVSGVDQSEDAIDVKASSMGKDINDKQEYKTNGMLLQQEVGGFLEKQTHAKFHPPRRVCFSDKSRRRRKHPLPRKKIKSVPGEACEMEKECIKTMPENITTNVVLEQQQTSNDELEKPEDNMEEESVMIQSRKRKSCDVLSIEDAKHDLPNKKVRKSRRLEEKRLAREKKTKID